MSLPNANEEKFRFYPTDSVVCHFAATEDAEAALLELKAAGYINEQFDILAGPEGADALDRTGEKHGLMARVARFFQQLSNSEHPIMKLYEDALNAGHVAVAVTVDGDQERIDEVREVYKRHNGQHIVYYGKQVIRKLER